MTTMRPGLDGLRASALGWFPGSTGIIKFGRNTSVDATGGAQEDIWAGGGLYTGFPVGATATVAETVTVVSSSTADTAAGTGMRAVRLVGLGSTGVDQTEDVVLNGTSAVTSTKTWYRLFRAFGISGGSGQTNAGAITIRHSVTTANIMAILPVGTGQTQSCVYTVPVDRVALVTRAHFTVSNAQQSAQEVTLTFAARAFGTNLWRHLSTQHVTTSSPTEVQPFGGSVAPALTDLAIRATLSTSAGLDVTASMELFLFPP